MPQRGRPPKPRPRQDAMGHRHAPLPQYCLACLRFFEAPDRGQLYCHKPDCEWQRLEDGLVKADEIASCFRWSGEILWGLVDLPSNILIEDRARELSTDLVPLLESVLARLQKARGFYERLFRGELEEWRSYFKRRTSPPYYGRSLTSLQAVVWNLAPFFQHNQQSDPRHKGEVAWKELAKFLDSVPLSGELAKEHRSLVTGSDDNEQLEKEAERLKKIHKRLCTRESPPKLLPGIRLLLARHRVESPLKSIHKRAAQTLNQAGL